MRIDNSSSPSFGSIQVGLSKMSKRQMGLSDSLFKKFKYSSEYNALEHEDIDVYILPAPKDGVNVRLMDPYSGNFIRIDKKIYQEGLNSHNPDTAWETVDKVLNILKDVVNGKISRPKENVSSIISNKTEMAKINPSKHDDLSRGIREYMEIGFTQKEAENVAHEEFKGLYHINNRDADF